MFQDIFYSFIQHKYNDLPHCLYSEKLSPFHYYLSYAQDMWFVTNILTGNKNVLEQILLMISDRQKSKI